MVQEEGRGQLLSSHKSDQKLEGSPHEPCPALSQRLPRPRKLTPTLRSATKKTEPSLTLYSPPTFVKLHHKAWLFLIDIML